EVPYLLSFLPQNNMEEPHAVASKDPLERLIPELRTLVPSLPNQPYDVKTLIEAVVDDGEYLEYFPHFSMTLVCCFARIGGQVIGIVANQPQMLAGVLDIDSS